jgi:TPR repeat protein
MLLTTSKFSGYLSVLKPKEESALLADPGTWYMSLHRQAERLDGFGQHPDRALALHRAAAERGGAEGVVGLARHMARSERLRRQESEFEAALKAAGHAGDPGSMAALAGRLEARGEKRRALGWFVSAQQRGSLYGAMGVARAMARGETGTEEAPRKAIDLLRLLAEAEFVPARLELALLLTDGVEGVAPAPDEAARLLMSNVRMDHAPSIRELADAVLFERLPAPTGFKAEKALRDLAEDGDASAKYLLGMAIRGERTQKARAEEALQLLQEAANAGVMDARNDLAWISCTSQRAEYFEPVRGLQVARRMAMEPHLSASNKDTLAACHAANGEFEQAIALMREVLAPEASHSGEQRARYADRLQRFERGEIYRESR